MTVIAPTPRLRRGEQAQRPKSVNVSLFPMNPNFVKAASAVITNQQILVNMVSRRVRQLTLGHRPLVEFVPGLGLADIALCEIAGGKLIFESTVGQNGKGSPAEVVQFPGIIVATKNGKDKAA